jgi:flavorubredoxin
MAPNAQVAHGMTGCSVSLNDIADRPPRVLANGEVIDIGGKRIRYIDTPHMPHGWDAVVIYEGNSRTLFCGDRFTHLGNGPAITESDIVGPALAAEDIFYDTSLGPSIAPTVRRLADLAPRTLALMHGSTYAGDTVAALHDLATAYDRRLRAAMAEMPA